MKKTQILLALVAVAAFCTLPPTAFGATSTINPVADAFVATGPTGNLRDNNYGGGGALVVAAPGLPNGEFQTVLKFDFSGTRSSLDAVYGVGQWSIQSVTLQLTSSPHSNPIYNNVAPGQFGVSLMQNSSWTEGTGTASIPTTDGITYNTLQNTYVGAADQGLGTFSFPGDSTDTHGYSLSLSSALTADILEGDDVSLRLYAADNALSYLLTSRAGSPASVEPELIITAVPEPGGLALLGLAVGMTLRRGRRWLIATRTN